MFNYLSVYSNLDTSVKRDRKFWLQKIEGSEGLCEDFDYSLKVNSLERLSSQDIEKLLGDAITVELEYLAQNHLSEKKYINGLVYKIVEAGLSRAPLQPDVWEYTIEIGPWFRQLDYIKDCRIFQKGGNNSMKIVSELLNELGFRAFKDKTKGKLPAREYSVIYNETISDYIRRICLEDGILWRYEHFEKRHELVFYNHSSDLPEIPDHSRGVQDGVFAFCHEKTHIPIKESTISSYHWETSPVKKVKKTSGLNKATMGDFRYRSSFKDRDEGEQQADRRIQSLKSRKDRFYGQSTMRHFTSGASFNLHASTLKDHHRKSFLIKHLFLKATRENYTNSFEAVPAGTPYYPAVENRIKRPVIVGTQTAVVVGAEGKGKVSSNKHGQVKVRFHWDHHPPDNAIHTSAYVRVSNPAAGSQRGFVFTPRIDEEVIISYENGNPDKPLIVGSVYSKNRPTPGMQGSGSLKDSIMNMTGAGGGERYVSPVSQLYSGTIKSDEDKDSNRMTLNDQKGNESYELNAKKDLNMDVGRDLNIDVEDDIYIFANQENINAKESVKSQAGGSIINGTLTAMVNTAGRDISHMALGGIFNIAGGVISNMAGATITNTAILSVKNEASGPLKQEAATLLANTALGTILNTADNVFHEGDLAVTNISLAEIINIASKEIETKSMFQKVQTDNESNTETGDFVIKGIMPKINS
ncbi:MAG: type VI secretion system tip protein VgrG [Proteobacteria bacterium]|nr:type VI secretion system tip protein VgrG [Pseudomonadota bacterium]